MRITGNQKKEPPFPIAGPLVSNAPFTLPPGRGVLHEIFEAQADLRPHAAAVVYGRQSITYAALERYANRWARLLRRHSVGPGSVVAMLLPRSIEAYGAILGILKSGAAYVPLDPEYPADRINYILKNSRARILVTASNLAPAHAGFHGGIVRVDADRKAIESESDTRLQPHEVGVGPRDLCYIIYTSGSTGRPKGVMIEHRNASHLVRAEREIYKVQAEDRVYQGASLSFDLSVEEVWLAFASGATLVAATPEMAHAGPDLSRLLTESGVTVLSCVPTLLSMLEEDVPALRLLIFGGEVCPDWLVARWARPGRRIINTYGPTETTVIATYAEVSPGKPVTIGRAVPGYSVYLLDESLQPVPPGQAGEICVGGPGVARGYVGLPEQTQERFLPDPFAHSENGDARLYRTGDMGRLNAEGDLEFVGRVDAQVKLRGFRVELSEIEAVLLQADNVQAAACAVREDQPGIQQLVGYVVPAAGAQPEEERLRSFLRGRLPAYMVPALIETVDSLPLLPSGKLDRASLPAPRSRANSPSGKSLSAVDSHSQAGHAANLSPLEGEHLGGTSRQKDHGQDSFAPSLRSPAERRLGEIWQTLFPSQPISRDDDFFLDLGGHSLLAARMVSELRKDPRFARVSVADVYAHPTIAKLAATIEAEKLHAKPRLVTAPQPVAAPKKPAGEGRRHFIAGVVQAAALYFVFALQSVEWISPYLVYLILNAEGYSPLRSAEWAGATAVGMFPVLLLVALAAKWLVLGRVRPGHYPLWGSYYLRWWFAHSVMEVLPLHYLGGTPLLPMIYRLFGARIGKDVHLRTNNLGVPDLISIGDGATINDVASLLAYAIEDGEFILGPIAVGRDCFLGTRSFLRENTVMEDGSRLEDLSLLPAGGRIPAGETWKGSPARPVAPKAPEFPARPAFGRLRRLATTSLYTLMVLVLSAILLSALTPGLVFLLRTDVFIHPWLYLGAAPLVGASFVLTLCCAIVALKWIVLGRVRPGTYAVHGSFYVRNWLVDQLMALALDLVGGIHATLYVLPWYRVLGAKLGRLVELSTAMSTTADLLDLGDGATIADEVSLGSPFVENGWMKIDFTRFGSRAFVGNSGVIPTGATLGDESLVGVLSIAPTDRPDADLPRASWLGSPPILLPRRQPSANFSEEKTYNPPRKLRVARAAFEIFRITLPPAGFILVAGAVLDSALRIRAHLGLGPMLALLPLVYMAACAAAALAVAGLKWALIGRFRPFARPLWSNFIWRLELQNALYEFFVTPLALKSLRGTPFLPWYHRLLGAKIGRQVYTETTGLLEFDLVEVADRAALNVKSVLQTHLFEDRVLKSSGLHIGKACTLGAESVILYDSIMEDGSRLDAISLLMKGEILPANTAWAGIPAQPVAAEAIPAQLEQAA